MKADVVGLVALAILVGVAAIANPLTAGLDAGIIFIFAMWAASAVFVWKHPSAPQSPKKWIYLAMISLPGAAISYGFMRATAAVLFLGGDEPEGSRFFDIAVTFMLAPGFTFIAIAGAARSAVATGYP